MSTIRDQAVAASVILAVCLVAVALIVRAARRYGARTIAPADRAQARRDRWLFAAGFLFAAVVYVALILGSFEGLTSWARDTLGWDDWRQYIVPVSVDGLGTAAGVLAFRAIRRRTSPLACYVMVWGATATSMTVNAVEGGKHGAAAAFYMSFLSAAVMAMFHLFLGQFQAGAEYVGRKYPRFGLRWITYWQTPLDFLCWVNHPPAAGTEPTVNAAVEHRQAWRSAAAERSASAAAVRHRARLLALARKAELAEAAGNSDPVEGDETAGTGPQSRTGIPRGTRTGTRRPGRTGTRKTKRTGTRGTSGSGQTEQLRAAAAELRNAGEEITGSALMKKVGMDNDDNGLARRIAREQKGLYVVHEKAEVIR